MDLLLGILAIVGIVFGIFLIILLARLGGAMKKISGLLDEIDDPVTRTVSQLPDLIKTVDGVTKDVSVLTESAKQTVPQVLDDVQTMTGTVRSGVEAVGGAARSVGEGISSFFHPADKGHPSQLGSILEVVSQIMSIVSLFTGKRKESKAGRQSRNKKRRR